MTFARQLIFGMAFSLTLLLAAAVADAGEQTFPLTVELKSGRQVTGVVLKGTSDRTLRLGAATRSTRLEIAIPWSQVRRGRVGRIDYSAAALRLAVRQMPAVTQALAPKTVAVRPGGPSFASRALKWLSFEDKAR